MNIDVFKNTFPKGELFRKCNYVQRFNNRKYKTNFLESLPNEPTVYLLVVNQEIVYIGYSSIPHQRIIQHMRKMLISDVYILQTNDAYNQEQKAIQFAKPIFNNNKFTKFEQRYSGKPQSFEFCLGYVTALMG